MKQEYFLHEQTDSLSVRERMQKDLVDLLSEYYRGSDFHNYGYWRENTHNPEEACENLMEKVLGFLPEKKGNILDVGCGLGATTRYLMKHFRSEDITAIDVSEEKLERCPTNAPGCRFMNMDATHLEFEDNSFDNIISIEAAFHFRSRKNFFQEANRVLRPGRYLLMADILLSKQALESPRLKNPENFVVGSDEYRGMLQKAGHRQRREPAGRR